MGNRKSFSTIGKSGAVKIQKQKQKFPSLVRDVIDISDIILEVLDARFINDTRNFELENMILNEGKKLIYVLNKSDIIDLKVKIDELNKLKISPAVFVSCKDRKGITKLRNRIKQEVRKLDLGEKKRAQVGIVGYPNTGKSSLINLLTGRSSAKTGAQAGFTKGMQKISLTKGILILDTPGVIPEEEYSNIRREAIQKHARIGARTIDTIRDPEMVVAGLMKTHSKQIEEFYGVDVRGDTELLIETIGKKKGFLKKGGSADEDRTAKLIIQDWQTGRITL